ncbi:MAG: enoyl-CoA hydratase [Alphaproteobacteria bacterium]|nr:enoyl-CoA hydratase [Alphaproteobacteria bacterium]
MTQDASSDASSDVFSRSFETIVIERRERAALVRINRPQALNALNMAVGRELIEAFEAFDRDPQIGCIVLTGSEKAFAAGADIKEMQALDYMTAFLENRFANWENIGAIRKPIIAAVSGFALGGGCELAMMCDMIFASDTAKFGQPEVRLGIMPGMGGTQRFTRAVGKSKAMDMCLTGRMMDAQEAERAGLVARIIAADKLLDEALTAASAIAEMSQPSVMMIKESVNRAFETSLAEGLRFERRVFHSAFATQDQKEGMAAFVEKRKPAFKNR